MKLRSKNWIEIQDLLFCNTCNVGVHSLCVMKCTYTLLILLVSLICNNVFTTMFVDLTKVTVSYRLYG